MTSLPQRADVVIIGAGLAGLRAAELLADRAEVVVLEAAEQVGGRIRTDQIGGFLLDHGFQLLNPAYPAARSAFDLDRLQLGSFAAGVISTSNQGSAMLADPRRDPGSLPKTVATSLSGHLGAPWHQAAFAAYVLGCSRASMAKLRQRPDISIGAALRAAGVRGRVLDRVVQPFLAGVLADTELVTSRRYADLVLRSFGRGVPGVPAAGMQALPEQIAARLPDNTLFTGSAVTAIRATEVQTINGAVKARAVVVATDASAAGRLLPGLQVRPTGSLTTWYFSTADELLPTDQMLRVEGGGRGPLVNLAVMNKAAPSYAPVGKALVAATAVGFLPDAMAAARARFHAGQMLGVDPALLTEIGRYPIEHALPRALGPFQVQENVELGDGVFVIGDHRDTPSIQGALVSGRRGAGAVVAHLGMS